MPTLEETPILEKLSGFGMSLVGTTDPPETPVTLDEGDLINVYDVSTGKPKSITIADLAGALGINLYY